MLIVGVGVVWVQRLGEAQRQYAALQEAQERMSQILAAGDAELHSVPVGGGTATVAVSDRLGDGVVLVENLPDRPRAGSTRCGASRPDRPAAITTVQRPGVA